MLYEWKHFDVRVGFKLKMQKSGKREWNDSNRCKLKYNSNNNNKNKIIEIKAINLAYEICLN